MRILRVGLESHAFGTTVFHLRSETNHRCSKFPNCTFHVASTFISGTVQSSVATYPAYWAMSDMSLAMCLYLCRHIIESLRLADSDVPSAVKTYAACQDLHETAKPFSGLTAPTRTVVNNLVHARWDMLTTGIHLAGYVLDPEFLPRDVTKDKVSFCMRRPFLCTNTATASLESALIYRVIAGGHAGIHEYTGEGLQR